MRFRKPFGARTKIALVIFAVILLVLLFAFAASGIPTVEYSST